MHNIVSSSSALSETPIYFLPAKLLSSQSNQLAEQAAKARKAVDDSRDDWAAEQRDRTKELDELKEKRDRGLEELERADREERITRERLARDAQGDEEEAKPSTAPAAVVKADEEMGSPAPAVSTAPSTTNAESTEMPPTIATASAATDIGEDAVEY